MPAAANMLAKKEKHLLYLFCGCWPHVTSNLKTVK
jgi:hypothetical protein